MRTIDNSEDIIDSRDVMERIEELERERDSTTMECTNCAGTGKDIADASKDCAVCDGSARVVSSEYWADDNQRDAEELANLRAFADDLKGYGDFEHGEALIRESYFETYAQQLAEDIGALENCTSWPATCIDWEQAARELRMDYTEADLDGVTYLMRA